MKFELRKSVRNGSRAMLGMALAFGLVASGTVLAPSSAQAASTDVSAAKGRATGSDKWGYVGQFGKLNNTTQPQAGEFFLPYGIDIDGNKIAVTDSGIASWEPGTKTPGHSLQTFALTSEPGSAGHGDYLGDGKYNIVDTKSSVADPANIVDSVALDYYAVNSPRGPRGVAYKSDGSVVGSSYEAGSPAPTLQMRQYANDSLGTPTSTYGTSQWGQSGYIGGAVGTDTDSQGNVYIGTTTGVSVYDSTNTFRSSVGSYFDQNGSDQSARVAWATRMADVKATMELPDLNGETYGLSVMEENGKIVVYVGDAGAYYQPDPSVHFQDGSPAKYTKPASIKKYTLEQSGGTVNARWNPSGWKWKLDTSFGIGGAVQFTQQNTLINLFGRYIFQGQTVFALKADPESGTLYYSLNGQRGPKLGALDLNTGGEKLAPAPVNSPNTQQDSAMNYVRGIAVDDRGLVYATTQNSTSTSTTRAVVQIWGKTPTSIAGTGSVTPGVTSADVSWGKSTVGYQQPDLLDYVVKYREKNTTDWTTAPIADSATTSTDTSRTITGLKANTCYEGVITPFNEAGSGDPANVEWCTTPIKTGITVAKTGNGEEAQSADAAIEVPADSNVVFNYTVTNNGNVPVTGLSLSDSKIGAVTTVASPADFDGTLAPGASVTYATSGPVAAGDYTNTVTATGTSDGKQVTAEDRWYGYGVNTDLSVVKTGNSVANDSDEDALHVPAGSTVSFKYEITNGSNIPVVIPEDGVQDSVLGTIAWPDGFDGTLPANDSVTFTASGPVAAGAYANTVTVKADGGVNGELTATDTWYGFGVTSGINIVKQGNGKVATTKDDAIDVPAGDNVTFTYIVTNTGNTRVSDLNLTDSVLGKVGTVVEPAGFDGTLEPGSSVTFKATGAVGEGAYTNKATASGVAGGIDKTVESSTDWFGHGDKKETPVDPVNPVEPVDPGNPENPEEPKNPADNGPKSPETPKDDLANTGGSTVLPFAVGAGALIAAGGVLILLRRRSANKLD